MVLEAETKFYSSKNRVYLYIPSDIVKDSQFPFKNNERVLIKIKKKELIVKKK